MSVRVDVADVLNAFAAVAAMFKRDPEVAKSLVDARLLRKHANSVGLTVKRLHVVQYLVQQADGKRRAELEGERTALLLSLAMEGVTPAALEAAMGLAGALDGSDGR